MTQNSGYYTGIPGPWTRSGIPAAYCYASLLFAPIFNFQLNFLSAHFSSFKTFDKLVLISASCSAYQYFFASKSVKTSKTHNRLCTQTISDNRLLRARLVTKSNRNNGENTYKITLIKFPQASHLLVPKQIKAQKQSTVYPKFSKTRAMTL